MVSYFQGVQGVKKMIDLIQKYVRTRGMYSNFLYYNSKKDTLYIFLDSSDGHRYTYNDIRHKNNLQKLVHIMINLLIIAMIN